MLEYILVITSITVVSYLPSHQPTMIRRNLSLVYPSVSDQVSPSRTAYFAVPFERDSEFIGREDIITEIDRKFEVQRRVALAGIGGVG